MALVPLPIDSQIQEIVATVRTHAHVILTATPGAGKTTRLPPALLSAVEGRILVLQPRRMAAVAAAHRVASEQGWEVGGAEVGYQVRFESRVSRSTRLIFLTDALALRQMISDPELGGVGLIIIDEFHERNLNQDLMLGCLRELNELGRSIRILVMSATLDTRRLLDFLPGAVHVDVPGIVYPLDIRHSARPLSMRTDFEFIDRVAGVVREAASERSGDVLVFLPGVGEINRLRDRLRDDRGFSRDIQVLHGSLTLAEQQKVLRASPAAPRVILSTNVAEASVTVDGVDGVIDTGLAKVVETDSKTGFSSLELRRIARFNARQRAGRAARQRAGVCWRLWTPFEETTQAEALPAEVERSELSQAFLLLASLGVSDFASFAWLDSPPTALMSLAVKSLRAMRALDSDNRLTDFGRRLLQFPLAPRWGALLALGEDENCPDLAADMAAILNERDFVEGAPTTRLECDLSMRLDLLDEARAGRGRGGVQPVIESARQLRSLVRSSGDRSDRAVDRDRKVRQLLITSQRDRLCRRRLGSERALMVGGRGVKLSTESQVKASEFFLALQGMNRAGQADTTISIACGLTKDFVLSALKEEITVKEDVYFDEAKQQFFGRRVRYFEDLPLDEPTLSSPDAAKVSDAIVALLLERWDQFIAKHEGLSHWMARLRFGKLQLEPEQKRQFAEMASFGKTSLAAVLDQDLTGLLESTLDREWVRKFNDRIPSHFQAATGNRYRIDYTEGHSAFVEVRLQEMFGVKAHPRILDNQVPITFRLLGPNYRPVQVTSDLAGFWKGAYVEVRKELRARYPKHSWPEDPANAIPEAKGRRRT